MHRRFRFIIALTLLATLYALPVAAQPQQMGPWFFTIDGGGAHQSEADLDDSTGAFSKDRWFVSAGVDYAFSRRNSIGISVGGGQSDYEFTDETDFGGGIPWGKIDDTRVSLNGRFGFGETGTIFIIPTLRFNGEKDASSSDSRTWGVFAAATWRLKENLTIGPGIGIFSRLESSTKFFPILAIDWDINDRWNLSTGRGLASSQGPGLTLSYELNDDWSFGLSGRYENQEFRLDDEGPAPGGVGRDKSIPMVFSANLTPNKKLNFSVFAGLEFAGQLKLKDALDEVVEESDYDPALLFGATFEIRF
jgi:outer membrane scaffolding protein for murein synthesis (MipA/OmpV family)